MSTDQWESDLALSRACQRDESYCASQRRCCVTEEGGKPSTARVYCKMAAGIKCTETSS